MLVLSEKFKMYIVILTEIKNKTYIRSQRKKWYKILKLFAAAKSLQSCLTLCDPIDGSLPGSSVPGILQARTLEWVAISFSNARKWKVKVKSLQSCPTLSDPMDCSLPGSSVHGIFQARVLEWGAIAFSHPSILVLGNSSALSFLYSPILTSIHDHWKNHSLD